MSGYDDFDFNDDSFEEDDIDPALLRKRFREDPGAWFSEEEFAVLFSDLLTRGQLDMAERLIKRGLEQYPYSGEMHMNAGLMQMRRNRFREAMVSLKEALRIDPHFDETHLALAHLYLFYSDENRATHHYNRALSLSGDSGYVLMRLAKSCTDLHAMEFASGWLGQAEFNRMPDEEDLSEICDLFEISGENASGAEFFEKITNHYPYCSAAWFLAGQLYTAMEENDKALSCFEYAALSSKEPKVQESAVLNMADLHVEKEEYSRALEILEQAEKDHGLTAPIAVSMGFCLSRLEQPSAARRYFRLALSKDSSLAHGWYGLGLSYLETDEFREAIQYLDKAFRIDKDNFMYGLSLAFAQYSDGDEDAAMESYNSLVERWPNYFEGWIDCSTVLHESGRTDEAIRIINEAIERLPENHQLYYRLAALQFVSGNENEGQISLLTALSLNPSDYHLLFNFAPELKEIPLITETIELHKP